MPLGSGPRGGYVIEGSDFMVVQGSCGGGNRSPGPAGAGVREPFPRPRGRRRAGLSRLMPRLPVGGFPQVGRPFWVLDLARLGHAGSGPVGAANAWPGTRSSRPAARDKCQACRRDARASEPRSQLPLSLTRRRRSGAGARPSREPYQYHVELVSEVGGWEDSNSGKGARALRRGRGVRGRAEREGERSAKPARPFHN